MGEVGATAQSALNWKQDWAYECAVCGPRRKAHPKLGISAMSQWFTAGALLAFTCLPGYGQDSPTVMQLLMQAYDVTPNQVAGAPDWLENDKVTAPPEGITPEETKGELQKFLAGRFHLVVHRETKVMPMFVLRVDAGGARLKEWAPPLYWSSGKLASIDRDTLPKKLKTAKDGCPEVPPGGTFTLTTMSNGSECLIANGETMAAFAGLLSQRFKSPMVDGTGLSEKYNIRLRFDPALTTSGLSDALQKQLGLILDTRNGLAYMLVIDHIEKPPAN
jgi:uncharacterized protein (TIGR03435 family)